MKYITDKKRHWSENVFWVIILSLAITTSGFLIYESFRKWQMAPVIVSFSEKFINIWEIPFASITICPIVGVNPIRNLSMNFTGSTERKIKTVSWKSDLVNATELFTEVATTEGFCFAFNMMRYDDIFHKDT